MSWFSWNELREDAGILQKLHHLLVFLEINWVGSFWSWFYSQWIFQFILGYYQLIISFSKIWSSLSSALPLLGICIRSFLGNCLSSCKIQYSPKFNQFLSSWMKYFSKVFASLVFRIGWYALISYSWLFYKI